MRASSLTHSSPARISISFWALLAFCLLALSGCSGKTYPFGKGAKAMPPTAGTKPPKLHLAVLRGVPKPASGKLLGHLAQEALARNLRFAQKPSPKHIRLEGYFSTADTRNGQALAYVWDLTDPRTGKRFRVTGERQLDGPQAKNAWGRADDALMHLIARQTADGLTNRLSKLGYQVRLSAVPPPDIAPWTKTYPIAAREPDPKRDFVSGPRPLTIDELTNAAPQPAPKTQPLITAGVPPRKKIAKQQRRKPVRKTTNTSFRAAKRPARIARAPQRGLAATIGKITGASAPARLAMKQAIRTQLIRAGIVVYDQPHARALTISGEVTTAPPKQGRRLVSLQWHVVDANGKKLGDLSQSNRIAAKTWDNDWGGNAGHAAAAAANGIIELLSRGS